MSQPLVAGSLKGKTALVTGSSRGIGADTVRYFAEAGANVVINFRNKAPRAEKLAARAARAGRRGARRRRRPHRPGVGAGDVRRGRARRSAGSTSSSSTPPAAWSPAWPRTTRCSSTATRRCRVLEAALPLLGEGSRVVFVTSHQAHFIRTTPTMPEYEPVALSKRAGEDALRERIPALAERGIGFVVVSGDMIEGTITATLLERANPGAIAARRESAGKLYNVGEFAAEVARAAVDPIPADNTRLVGDTSSFAGE